MSAIVKGGATFMPRSKSTFRGGLPANGLATLTRIQHHAHRERNAAIHGALKIRAHIEDIAVEQRQLAVEFADNVFAAQENEVGPHEREDRNSGPPQQREDDRIFLRHE